MNRPSYLKESREHWVPPEGLERCRPRSVTLTRAGIVLLTLAVALFLGSAVAGVVLASKASRDAARQRLLQQEGVNVEAQITQLGHRGGEGKRPWAIYQFTAEGRSFERRVNVSEQKWKRLSVGARFPMRYLPSDPTINQPRGGRNEGTPMWVAPLAAAALGLGASLCLLAIRRQRRFLEDGRAAPARVTKHKLTKDGCKFYYEFPLLSGATALGQGGPAKHPPAVGTTLCILYDADDPKRNTPYPLSLVKLR